MSNEPILDPIHRVSDLETAGDFERKHTPFISAEKTDEGFNVTVETGHIVKHPSVPDHWINWLEIRAGESCVARFDFSCVVAPHVHTHVKVEAGTELTVISSCNMHGLWESKITL